MNGLLLAAVLLALAWGIFATLFLRAVVLRITRVIAMRQAVAFVATQPDGDGSLVGFAQEIEHYLRTGRRA